MTVTKNTELKILKTDHNRVKGSRRWCFRYSYYVIVFWPKIETSNLETVAIVALVIKVHEVHLGPNEDPAVLEHGVWDWDESVGKRVSVDAGVDESSPDFRGQITINRQVPVECCAYESNVLLLKLLGVLTRRCESGDLVDKLDQTLCSVNQWVPFRILLLPALLLPQFLDLRLK